MSEAPQQEASHRGMNHGLGDIEALFVGSHHAGRYVPSLALSIS